MKIKPNTFYCFSPQVMLLTFIVEVGMLVYVLLFRKMSIVTRLGAALLFCLALFQLAEYGICEDFGPSSKAWSSIGFVSITALPAFGLHLTYALGKRRFDAVLALSYLAMMVWAGLFIFGDIVTSNECGGNYLIFNLRDNFGSLYPAYYYVLLLMGTVSAWLLSRKTKKGRVRNALYSVIVGYLVFLLPTAVLTSIFKETARGIPSIMCGFAVFFAAIIIFYTLPKAESSKTKSEHDESRNSGRRGKA